MTEASMPQRAIRGAAEGAATGLAVAVVRASITLYRKGGPEDLGSVIPELVGFFLVNVLCCAYIFAVGRVIADGIVGSLLGAAILGVSGIFVGTVVPYDPTGVPYPMILGAAIGALIGSPLGASIHQKLNKPNTSKVE